MDIIGRSYMLITSGDKRVNNHLGPSARNSNEKRKPLRCIYFRVAKFSNTLDLSFIFVAMKIYALRGRSLVLKAIDRLTNHPLVVS